MPKTQAAPLVRFIRELKDAEESRAASDADLLRRFIDAQDEAAFRAIVRRHGDMVYRVCLRVLHREQDAEDAFQTTFVVLAQRARTLRRQDSLGSWLFGTAYRLACRLKRTLARRRARDEKAAPRSCPDPLAELSVREAQLLVDAEIGRLPDLYRGPFVLCCLEGATRDEAARQLGLTLSLLKKRLEAGRALLRKRLSRRGLTLTAALLASVLAETTVCAAISGPLVDSTVKAATAVAAGDAATTAISATAVALAEGVAQAMLLTKLRITIGIVLAATLIACAVAMLSPPAPAEAQSAAEKPKSGPPAQPAASAQAPTRWKERLRVDKSEVFSVAISPDGKKIVAAVGTRDAVLLDATTGQELAALPEGAHAEVTFSPDGSLMAQRDKECSILLCSAESGAVKATLEAPGAIGAARALAFSPDGKMLAAGYGGPDGGELRLWDLATRKVIREFAKLAQGQIPEPRVWSLAFSPDGKKLAAALGSDNVARVYEVATGKELVTFGKQPEWVIAVAFSPDGKTVAAADSGDEPGVKLWDVATGKERRTLKCPVAPYHGLAFSADGKVLAVVGDEPHKVGDPHVTAVHFWEPATGKQIAVLKSEEGRNWSQLGLARDGTLVMSGGDAVRVWELEKRPAPKKN